jgi:hypothetical protein
VGQRDHGSPAAPGRAPRPGRGRPDPDGPADRLRRLARLRGGRRLGRAVPGGLRPGHQRVVVTRWG